MICPHCNKNAPDNADYCPFCGCYLGDLKSNKPTANSSSNIGSFVMGIVSLVASLLSLLTLPATFFLYFFVACPLVFSIISLITGIVSLCLNNKDGTPKSKGVAIAGLIITGVILVLILVMSILFWTGLLTHLD